MSDDDYSMKALRGAEQLGNPARRLSVSNTSVSGMLPQMQNSQFILLNSAKASAIQFQKEMRSIKKNRELNRSL
jgi:hypothetical protein